MLFRSGAERNSYRAGVVAVNMPRCSSHSDNPDRSIDQPCVITFSHAENVHLVWRILYLSIVHRICILSILNFFAPDVEVRH
jgi:hypothetical protein